MVQAVSNTVLGIITDAMHDAGYLQEGQDPNSEQLAINMRRLCDLINLWQTQGIKLFLLTDTPIALIAGTANYVLGTNSSTQLTKPTRAIDGYWLSSDNIRRPLMPLSWKDWLTLSNVTSSSGSVNSYFIDKQATTLTVTFWPTPSAVDATGVAHLLLQTQVTNPINLTEQMAFPQEWRMALRWGLADDICTGQPQAIMDRCSTRATTYREALEDWDVEDAEVRFSPDPRMQTGGASFR